MKKPSLLKVRKNLYVILRESLSSNGGMSACGCAHAEAISFTALLYSTSIAG
jgi:hypothetical protein